MSFKMNKWPIVKLGTILSESMVETKNSNAERRLRVLLNAKGVIKRPLTKETEGATKYFERKARQFIYGKQNLHKGAFGIVPEELDGYSSSSDLPAFDVADCCLPEWIIYFLLQGNFYLSLIDIAKGAATKRIQPKALFQVEMPLPSVVEQKEIISKFTKKECKKNEILNEIKKQKQLLIHLKQSILQEAIRGELTKEWRKQNPRIEPASKLLERIKAEKIQLTKENKIKKENILPSINKEGIPFDLPDGWVWCRLGDVLLYSDSGKSPKCEKRPAKDEEWGVLTTTSIQKGYFVESANKVLPTNFKVDLNHRVEKDDILITRAGPLNRTGISCKVDSIQAKLILSDKTVRLKHPSGLISPDFLVTVLNSELIREVLIPNMTGMAESQVNISQSNIKTTLVPIAPLDEQNAVVQKVIALMEKCNALEMEISQSEKYAQMLMQAVLKEAFESQKELVI